MANGFRGEPDAVRSFSTHVDGCRLDTADGGAYLRRHGDLPVSEAGMDIPLINVIKGAHDDVMAELGARFDHLHDVLERSATALDRTAAYYEETEFDTAQQFDKELPPVDRPRRPR